MLRPSVLAALTVVTVSFGCKKPVDPPKSPATQIKAEDVVGLHAVTSIGSVPHTGWVRAVNAYGATVVTGIQKVNLDGDSTNLTFDAIGYGKIEVEEAGSVHVTGVDTPGWIHAIDTEWPGLSMMRTQAAATKDGTLVEEVTNGMLVANLTEVYWVDTAGNGHVVFTLPSGQIKGMNTGHIDADGLLDAVVWSEDGVFMLRARSGGGMGWGGGFEADGLLVGGADIGDVSGDGDGDVAIAWSGTQSWLDIWEGDALWNFAPVQPRPLTTTPTDIAIGDNSGEGAPQVTLLMENGLWERFVFAESQDEDTPGGSYIPTGPQLDFEIAAESAVQSGSDLNADGAEELFFIGKFVGGGNRTTIIFDLKGTNPEFLQINPPGAHFAFNSDSNGDSISDVFMFYSTMDLMTLVFNGQSYSQRKSQTLDHTHGPIGAQSFCNNGIPNVFVAGSDRWSWFNGTHTEADSGGTFWGVGEPPFIEVARASDPSNKVRVDFMAQTTDVTGSGVDIVGFEVQGGETKLKLWNVEPDLAPEATEVDEIVVSDSGLPAQDLAICGSMAYALVTGTLHAFDLTTASPWSGAATMSIATTATRVACGEGPNNSTVAILDGSTIDLLDDTLASQAQQASGNALDIALGDVGNGPEVAGCSEDDCSIVFWEEAGMFALGDPKGLSLFDGSDTTETFGAGTVSLLDVDGDGNDDLVAITEDGDLTLHRYTGEGIGPAEGYHGTTPFVGAAMAADFTGDGHANIGMLDETGALVFSPPFAECGIVEVDAGDDTADTGL